MTTTTRAALTDADIRLLLRAAAPEERSVAAHRVCRHLDRAGLTDAERADAEEILRLMAADAAAEVRRALAVTLKSSPLVPRDVANRLAADICSIATPMLSCSPAFSDEDLAEIVRVGGPVRQLAIARRPTLSTTVTTAIAARGVAAAVRAACENERASFSEDGLALAVERFEAAESVLAAIALRRALPASITERLLSLVAGDVREALIARQGLEAPTAIAIALGAYERASVDLVEQASRAQDLAAFVAHLRRGQRLTPSLMLRALAQGQMTFFEHGLAELSGVPHHRVWLMAHDAGELGLRAIYERAGLPSRLLPAFRAAVDAYHSLEYDGGPDELARFQRRMLERFLTGPHPASRDDLEYLLDKVDRLAPDPDLAAAAAAA